mmetsp:Transcript_12024/g.26249  ORF Transcript_12024/g.26249 Transcript_12024/m.26249 type:complete len:91 (+) Transcript_12024:116-388(+)
MGAKSWMESLSCVENAQCGARPKASRELLVSLGVTGNGRFLRPTSSKDELEITNILTNNKNNACAGSDALIHTRFRCSHAHIQPVQQPLI